MSKSTANIIIVAEFEQTLFSVVSLVGVMHEGHAARLNEFIIITKKTI